MPRIEQNRIIFSGQDWTDGLNIQYGSPALFMGSVVADSSVFNPYRPYGIASPGYLGTDVTNVSAVTGQIVGGINKYNAGAAITEGILISGGTTDGKIHELTYSTHTITNGGGTFPHAIDHAHANEVGEDIVAYSVGSTRYAFYSFRDDTDWDIGRYDYVTTFDDDYMSTVPASPLATPYLAGGKSAPHPLIVGDDDLLYVGDRNFVHSFDGQTGANGTFYAATWTLPAGYTVTSFAKKNEFLVVYAYRQDQTDSGGNVTGQATAFFFGYSSTDPVKVLDLDDNYVNGGFTWKGQCGCFTSKRPSDPWLGQSGDKSSDLRIFDGVEFKPVASFDGDVPIYRGVDTLGNEIQWNSSGTVFSYAERIRGRGYKLNKIQSAAGGTTSAFLKTMLSLSNTGAQQYMSAGVTTGGGLKYFGPQTYAPLSTMKTIYFLVPSKQGSINRLTSVELYLYSLGSANNTLTLNVNLMGNMGAQSQIVSNQFFARRTNQYTTDVNGDPFKDFCRIGLEMAWSSATDAPPQVDTVICYFEPINI